MLLAHPPPERQQPAGTPPAASRLSVGEAARAGMNEELARRAKRYGLNYIEAEALCLKRAPTPRGFRYLTADGRALRNPKALERIRSLAIPPAWTEVCIADDPRAHIQAVGRDAEGRLQYRYHDDWTAVRDRVKAIRMLRFGRALPKIRMKLEADLQRRKTDRRYAAAAAGRLIDRALIRAGHPVANAQEGGRGAATLLNRDVQLNGTKVRLKFVGKSGKLINKTIRDPILLSRLRKLKSVGDKRLFGFRDEKGRCNYLSARDLNDYLREAAGQPVTAKDFRTFAASSLALAALCEAPPEESESARKRRVAAVMRQAAEKLANTPAVTRSSYVHPLVVEAFEDGRLQPSILQGATRSGMSHAETALMRFLEEAFSQGPTPPASGNSQPERRVSARKQREEKRRWRAKPSIRSGPSWRGSKSA
jgi:DNA topoisomerase-1